MVQQEYRTTSLNLQLLRYGVKSDEARSKSRDYMHILFTVSVIPSVHNNYLTNVESRLALKFSRKREEVMQG